MLRLYDNKKVTYIDQSTIGEGTSSKVLIDRASQAFISWLIKQIQPTDNVHIICGNGNNGADGIRIGQLLKQRGYSIYLFSLGFLKNKSTSEEAHYLPVNPQLRSNSHILEDESDFRFLDGNGILVDAILGNGLNRKLNGKYAQLAAYINEKYTQIYAVDCPSGLLPHDQVTDHAIMASATFSFEFPKLAFFAAEHFRFVGHWDFKSIGLDQAAILSTPTNHFLIEPDDVCDRIKQRESFAHKGLMGRSLLIANNPNMMGAGLLAARACGNMGSGLVTVVVDSKVRTTAQLSEPAIIFQEWSENIDLEPYNCICVGPGLGQSPRSKSTVKQILSTTSVSLVMDADALNIIAQHQMSNRIPHGTVITPHIKEFERLFGTSSSHYERVECQRAKAIELGIYIVLKGRYTSIASPDGDVYYNRSGNAALARGGSGDVLAGMITALLSQGYSTLDALILAVFSHGHAADLYVRSNDELSMTPYVLLDYIPKALADITQKEIIA